MTQPLVINKAQDLMAVDRCCYDFFHFCCYGNLNSMPSPRGHIFTKTFIEKSGKTTWSKAVRYLSSSLGDLHQVCFNNDTHPRGNLI